MRTVLAIVFALAAAGYAVYVALANDAPIPLDLLFVEILGARSGLVVLGAFLAGAAVATLALAWPLARLRLRVRSQKRRVTRLEREVHGLRTLPIVEVDESQGGSQAQGG